MQSARQRTKLLCSGSLLFGVVLLLLCVLSAIGCGRGGSLDLAPVFGTVTYHGKPLTHGTVVFTPQQGTPGPQAAGKIQHDGSFRMRTAGQGGVAIGRHRVAVHCRGELTPEQMENLVVPESLIPAKYGKASESGLSFEVREGANEYAITL